MSHRREYWVIRDVRVARVEFEFEKTEGGKSQ